MLTSMYHWTKLNIWTYAINAADTEFDDAKLVLIKEAPSPVPNPLSSEFIAADFDGYSDKTVAAGTWLFAIGQDGQVIIRTIPELFSCSADNSSDPVIGWALFNSAKTHVLASCIFDEPVPMHLNGQELIVTAQINIPTTMDQPSTIVLP